VKFGIFDHMDSTGTPLGLAPSQADTAAQHQENTMQLGMIGLGRMGANMTRRLRRGGIDVVGYNREPDVTRALADEYGMRAAYALPDLAKMLAPPRIVWLMLPAGEITGRHITELTRILAPGDLIVDGANAHYKDSMRRAAELAGARLAFVDAGVSGGIWGLDEGYALMLGGAAADIDRLTPALRVLAPAADRGWLHCGPRRLPASVSCSCRS
jgi:6-phosphogluconate dehydrogenase